MHLRLSLFAAALLSFVASPAARSEATAVAGLRPEHPRLLATTDDWSNLAQRRATEPDLAAYHDALVAAARQDLDLPPVTYLKTGKRLLVVSREVLRRVL